LIVLLVCVLLAYCYINHLAKSQIKQILERHHANAIGCPSQEPINALLLRIGTSGGDMLLLLLLLETAAQWQRVRMSRVTLIRVHGYTQNPVDDQWLSRTNRDDRCGPHAVHIAGDDVTSRGACHRSLSAINALAIQVKYITHVTKYLPDEAAFSIHTTLRWTALLSLAATFTPGTPTLLHVRFTGLQFADSAPMTPQRHRPRTAAVGELIKHLV